MSFLSKIKTESLGLPPRILLLGVEGVGKTTFAANSPSPLFICSEEGVDEHDGIPRFIPESYQDIHGLLDELISTAKIPYKTIVIDTVDWLERMIHDKLCKEYNEPNIEGTDKGSQFGYGKGGKLAEKELVLLLKKLDTLRSRHQMGVIICGHLHIKTFTDPDGASFDRWEAKGHKGFTGLLREWPDACLSATFEVFQTQVKGEQRKKTIGGERIMHTVWSPSRDAKNRLSLPPVLPLSYPEFEKAVQNGKSNNPEKMALVERIRHLYPLANIAEDDRPAWDAQMNQLEGMDIERLQKAVEILEGLTDDAK